MTARKLPAGTGCAGGVIGLPYRPSVGRHRPVASQLVVAHRPSDWTGDRLTSHPSGFRSTLAASSEGPRRWKAGGLAASAGGWRQSSGELFARHAQPASADPEVGRWLRPTVGGPPVQAGVNARPTLEAPVPSRSAATRPGAARRHGASAA